MSRKDPLTSVPINQYSKPVPEYIAYSGEKFQIEWYLTEDGASEPLEYFNELSEDYQAKTMALFKRMAETGEIRDKTKFRNEGDGIFAFKPQPYRFLCFFVRGRRIIITNGYYKKTDKLPKAEKARADRRKQDYESRTKKGTYYDFDL